MFHSLLVFSSVHKFNTAEKISFFSLYCNQVWQKGVICQKSPWKIPTTIAQFVWNKQTHSSEVIQTVISPCTVELSSWNTTLQIKVVVFGSWLYWSLRSVVQWQHRPQVWKDMWESKWWLDNSFKLFQSLLVFSNIQSFVKRMQKNNRVGGFSFFSPLTRISFCCCPVWHCQKWMPKQDSNVMSDGLNKTALSCVVVCECVCVHGQVCVWTSVEKLWGRWNCQLVLYAQLSPWSLMQTLALLQQCAQMLHSI